MACSDADSFVRHEPKRGESMDALLCLPWAMTRVQPQHDNNVNRFKGYLDQGSSFPGKAARERSRLSYSPHTHTYATDLKSTGRPRFITFLAFPACQRRGTAEDVPPNATV